MTCALKNMKGCISDRSKRQFHLWGLHDPIAALNALRKADLVIVDSLNGTWISRREGTRCTRTGCSRGPTASWSTPMARA
jgi:uncharacterized protein (DUF362 family)